MINAPLCWFGGKSRLRNTIIEKLPKHTCFVEVFGGAGWVLFGKEPSKAEVYNDVDGELVNFFRMVKHCHKAFVQAFDWILVSRKLFNDFIKTRPEDMDEIQRAVRFYYLIRASYCGKGQNFKYAKTGKSNLNLEDLYETISGIHNRLKRVYIEEGDFAELIARYDGPETIFYLDPPYYGIYGYRFNFKHEDFTRLAAVLSGIKGKFLFSINDHEVIRSMFSSYMIEIVEILYTAGPTKKRVGELLIRNY